MTQIELEITTFKKYHSTNKLSRNTYNINTNSLDYKLLFQCPYCEKEWQTKEYSVMLDHPPTSTVLVCHTSGGGCGNRSLILFEGGEE